MTTIKKLFFISAFLFTGHSVVAQHEDMVTWVSAGINFDITDNISCELNEEMRYNISVAGLYQLNTDVVLNYKFTKKIKIGIDYRYSVRETADVNRLGFLLTLREGVKDFDFSFRSKIQYSFIPDRREGTSWRNKGTIKYELNKKLTPYISTELFYSISNKINQFDNYRVEGGLQWQITKHHELNGFYLFDKEFNINDPLTLHIMGLGYVYKF